MSRMTHDDVMRCSNENIDSRDGFPLAIANEQADRIYTDMIAWHLARVRELIELRSQKATWLSPLRKGHHDS